jgi:hypothetical protein
LTAIKYLSVCCIVTWWICRLCSFSHSSTCSFHSGDLTYICWVAIKTGEFCPQSGVISSQFKEHWSDSKSESQRWGAVQTTTSKYRSCHNMMRTQQSNFGHSCRICIIERGRFWPGQNLKCWSPVQILTWH